MCFWYVVVVRVINVDDSLFFLLYLLLLMCSWNIVEVIIFLEKQFDCIDKYSGSLC